MLLLALLDSVFMNNFHFNQQYKQKGGERRRRGSAKDKGCFLFDCSNQRHEASHLFGQICVFFFFNTSIFVFKESAALVLLLSNVIVHIKK